MNRFVVLFFILLVQVSLAGIGLSRLKYIGVDQVYVCGDRKIQPTRSSLDFHFLLGKSQTGYVLSDLIPHDEYWNILKRKKLKEAQAELKQRFQKTRLWKVQKEETQSLSFPEEIQLPFTATVKDCVSGAPTNLKKNCQGSESCCMEKFVGPVVTWKQHKQEFKLYYSPDPSVKLRISKTDVRYCNVQKSFKLQDL